MEKTQMITREQAEGEVKHNDGYFAEVLTHGIEGIENNLLLETIQVHCEDTEDTPEKFQRRFPVGTTLSILTITEITTKSSENVSAGDGQHRRLPTGPTS